MYITKLHVSDALALATFFETVAADETAAHFRPHSWTAESADRIAGCPGRDVYLAGWRDGVIAGYGFLRGWDDGWDVPSLGIYIAPCARRSGRSRLMMDELEKWAITRDAQKMRLRVHPDNLIARKLYESCGYTFDGTIERGELVGYKQISHAD